MGKEQKSGGLGRTRKWKLGERQFQIQDVLLKLCRTKSE